jgi:hypothetical protein
MQVRLLVDFPVQTAKKYLVAGQGITDIMHKKYWMAASLHKSKS